MQVILTQDEKLEVVYKCLTTGMPYFVDYGFSLNHNGDEYRKVRDAVLIPGETICLEDVQREMLREGYGLTFTDEEGEGDNTAVLTLELMEKNWDKIPPAKVVEMVTGDWDADTADVLMQYILFGEVVYG